MPLSSTAVYKAVIVPGDGQVEWSSETLQQLGDRLQSRVRGNWEGCDRGVCRYPRMGTIPEWALSFQVAPDAKVFAMGSCFARNVEAELLKLAFNNQRSFQYRSIGNPHQFESGFVE